MPGLPSKPACIRGSALGLLLAALLLHSASPAWSGSAASPAISRFVEETETAGLQSRFEGEDEFMVGGGVAVFDCDDDGLPETYVSGGVNKSKFYRNRSTRIFTDDGSQLDGGSVHSETIAACDQYGLQGDAFSRVVRGEIALPYGVEDAIANMRVIDALFASEKTGAWVTI